MELFRLSLDSQEKIQIWNRRTLPWIWLIVVSIKDLYQKN